MPGLTAAKCGGHVTFTDREGNPRFRDTIRRSCDINGVESAEVKELTWGVFSPLVLALPPSDIILASDCFYCSKGTYMY